MRLAMLVAAAGAAALTGACGSGGSNNQAPPSANNASANAASGAPSGNAAVVGNAAQPAPAAGTQAQSADWSGTYNATGDGGTGSLVITSQAGGAYRGRLEIGGEGCGGSVEGTGTASGDRLVLAAAIPNEQRQCEITLTRDGNGLRIAEGDNCSHFHGASCGFEGSARR